MTSSTKTHKRQLAFSLTPSTCPPTHFQGPRMLFQSRQCCLLHATPRRPHRVSGTWCRVQSNAAQLRLLFRVLHPDGALLYRFYEYTRYILRIRMTTYIYMDSMKACMNNACVAPPYLVSVRCITTAFGPTPFRLDACAWIWSYLVLVRALINTSLPLVNHYPKTFFIATEGMERHFAGVCAKREVRSTCASWGSLCPCRGTTSSSGTCTALLPRMHRHHSCRSNTTCRCEETAGTPDGNTTTRKENRSTKGCCPPTAIC